MGSRSLFEPVLPLSLLLLRSVFRFCSFLPNNFRISMLRHSVPSVFLFVWGPGVASRCFPTLWLLGHGRNITWRVPLLVERESGFCTISAQIFATGGGLVLPQFYLTPPLLRGRLYPSPKRTLRALDQFSQSNCVGAATYSRSIPASQSPELSY